MIDLRDALTTSLLVLSLSTTVKSQTPQSIVPAADQTCANACTVFQDAFAACQPDVAVQAQYTSCLCQSGYLSPIKTSSGNICAPQCSDSDFANLANWYKGYCANNGGTAVTTAITVPGTTMITITTTPPPAGTTTSSAPTGGATQVEEGTSSDDGDETYSSGSAWLQSHLKWVIMIIVLAVGFAVLGIGGTFLRRRYKRKHAYGGSTPPGASNAAATHPEMDQWAPSQHSVHDFGAGPGATHFRQGRTDTGSPVSTIGPVNSNGNSNGNGEGNGKGKEVVGVSRVQSPAPSAGPVRVPSRRLSKTPTGRK